MKPLIGLGLVLAIIGLVMLAYPVFTTNQTKDVAKVGPLHLQENQQQEHSIPPVLSGGVLAVGVLLLAGGLLTRRE
jgi:uncharacterized membrane protein HdeD (DUF308 family)